MQRHEKFFLEDLLSSKRSRVPIPVYVPRPITWVDDDLALPNAIDEQLIYLSFEHASIAIVDKNECTDKGWHIFIYRQAAAIRDQFGNVYVGEYKQYDTTKPCFCAVLSNKK